MAGAHEQAAEQGEVVRWESYLWWVEAHVTLAEGRYSEALVAYKATVERLDRANQRWRQARTLIDRAEAYLARGEAGDRKRAGELLREAEAEFEAVGAPLYVQRVKARLGELGAAP